MLLGGEEGREGAPPRLRGERPSGPCGSEATAFSTQMRPCQRRGEGRPAGGDGKQFLKPAFAASLSQARVPSRVKLPAPAASGIVYTEGSSDKGGPEARPRAQKPWAQGQGGSLPTGYFSTQDLKGKTSRPLENLKAVFVYLKALPK